MRLLHVGQEPARADALQDNLRACGLLFEVVAVVRRDDRKVHRLRERDEDLVERLLLGEAVILQLHVEVLLAHHIEQRAQCAPARFFTAKENFLRDHAAHAGCGGDEARLVLLDELKVHAGRSILHALDPAEADDAREVRVALHALGLQHKVRVRTLARVFA